MNLLIERANQIINLDNVCGASYKIFSEEDRKLAGYKSVLYIYTTDGKEFAFYNKDADAVGKWLSEKAIQISD